MIQHYLNILRRWIWLLILVSIGSGAVAYWVTSEKPAIYEATSRLIVGPGIASVNPDLNAFRAGGQLMRTYAELATTRPVLESVNADIQLGLNSDTLQKMVNVRTDESTQIISIQVRGSDTEAVVTIANALANRLVRLSPSGGDITYEQVQTDVQGQIKEIRDNLEQSKETINQLNKQLLQVNSVDEKRLLLDQVNQIHTQQTDLQRILASLYDSYKSSNTNQIKVIELAVHAEKTASALLLATLIATIAGFTLTLTFVLAFEYFNDTIRTVSDLAYTVNVPILATMVKHKHLHGVGRERLIVHALPESRAAESYRVLSSKLLLSRFQNKSVPTQQNQGATNDREGFSKASTLHSVVICGTQVNEAVSEITANLAVLLAQTGHRVILVDAYLHRPSIHRLFGIPEQRGLADILLLRNLAPRAVIKQLRNSQSSADNALAEQDHINMINSDLHESVALVSVDWVPGLKILTSGTQPANPFELLVSPHMADLIKSLEKQADLVIIAASPLLASADSLILASRADGVVISARSDKTRRDTMKEIINALNSLNANILGTILNYNQEDEVSGTTKRSSKPLLTDKRKRQASSISA